MGETGINETTTQSIWNKYNVYDCSGAYGFGRKPQAQKSYRAKDPDLEWSPGRLPGGSTI